MASNPNMKVAASSLSPEHLQAFNQTLRHIVSTDIANHTLAQIVDGLPTRDVYYDYAHHHADIDSHLEPNSKAVKMAKALQEDFRPETLYIDSDVAHAYQNTVKGSREFSLRLLEAVAIAFHSIATLLFKDNNEMPYRSPTAAQPASFTSPPIPTFFYHTDYLDHDQYPLGIADIVGYWAEYQVFGGVVLFDRGESEIDCREALIHPAAGYRIFKLSEAQIGQFIDFGLGKAQPSDYMPECPLPFRAEKYADRFDPSESMALHIFRNKYERKPPPVRTGYTNTRCVRRLDDFPGLEDFLAKINGPETEG